MNTIINNVYERRLVKLLKYGVLTSARSRHIDSVIRAHGRAIKQLFTECKMPNMLANWPVG